MNYLRYRITQPTIAMFEERGRHVARHVPTDAIILVNGTLDGDKLTNVIWDDEHVMMFTQDLRSRAVPVSQPPPPISLHNICYRNLGTALKHCAVRHVPHALQATDIIDSALLSIR
jgi:hypothetical protein